MMVWHVFCFGNGKQYTYVVLPSFVEYLRNLCHLIISFIDPNLLVQNKLLRKLLIQNLLVKNVLINFIDMYKLYYYIY